ncbi:MAG: alpha/beta hydrolase [Chitinophagaceae bacterium]
MKRKLVRWLIVVLLVYVIGGVLLYLFQEKLIFHPEPLPPDYRYSFDAPFKEINLAINKEKNLSIVQFIVPDSVCKGVVLYFHGNRKNILRYADYASNFTKNNYEVWMIDYPGFGKSTGERTEQILYDDALRLYKMARVRFSPDSIIIYGKSIGTGIACQLASVLDCRHLILETPFYSGHALAKHFFPIYPVALMQYDFPSNVYAEKITAPVTIFHGTNDELIPYPQAKKLLKKFKTEKELVTIEKGKHNDLNAFRLFHQKLDSLLNL